MGSDRRPAPPGIASTNLLPVLDGDHAAMPANVFITSGNPEHWQLVSRAGSWKLVLLRALGYLE